MPIATTTTSDVLIALIASIPAILAAVFAGMVALRTKMPNGTRIGDAVAATQARATENHVMLRQLNGAPAEETQP